MSGAGGRSGNRDQRRQQQQQQAQQQLQNLLPLQTTGTVDAVVPGYIRILSTANQVWVLQVLPTAKCQVTGKAKAESLAPGYYIRFVGEVNKRGAVEQKVTKLTVFSPSQSRQPGAEPDLGFGTSFGARPGDEKKADAGAKPAFGAGAAAAADAGRAAGARKGGAGAKGPELFDIRGQIVGVSNGRLSLLVPNTYFRPSLRVEVAEDADIDVELDDPLAYALARKGDKIRVQGRQGPQQGMGNRGFAEELEITLAEPLGGPQEPKKHSAKGSKFRRGAEAEESADAKPADGKAEKKEADPVGQKGKKAEPRKAERLGAKKPAKTDAAADAAEEAPKKRTKAADADAPDEPPAKKAGKAGDAEAGDDGKK
jgi:hypothetical protein